MKEIATQEGIDNSYISRIANLTKLAPDIVATNRRGLRGVKLVISDSHEGIKAAVSKVLRATW